MSPMGCFIREASSSIAVNLYMAFRKEHFTLVNDFLDVITKKIDL